MTHEELVVYVKRRVKITDEKAEKVATICEDDARRSGRSPWRECYEFVKIMTLTPWELALMARERNA